MTNGDFVVVLRKCRCVSYIIVPPLRDYNQSALKTDLAERAYSKPSENSITFSSRNHSRIDKTSGAYPTCSGGMRQQCVIFL